VVVSQQQSSNEAEMESWLRHEEEVKTGNKVNMRNRPWNDDGGQRVVRGMKRAGWSRW